MHWLRVPFQEKDEAKSLGARWDAAARKWFVPDAVDLKPFERWQPYQSLQNSAAGEALTNADNESQSLSDFLERVHRAIRQGLPGEHWVAAEIASMKSLRNGHVRFELVQCNEGGEQIAHVQAVAFAGDWNSLLARFVEQTGAEPEKGMQVLLKVEARFDKRYGLDLRISDVDPAYTLGDLERRRRKIREMLAQEGIINCNRLLPKPREFCFVAVLAPNQAAGLGDFLSDAHPLIDHGLCRFKVYSAIFEGPHASSSICGEFDRIFNDHARYAHLGFDAVVLVRGGGPATGLAWLDHIEIARRICSGPIPVIVGIGHERDKLLLDELCCLSCDTPSKVIGYIRRSIVANARDGATSMQHIHRIALRITSQAETNSSTVFDRVSTAAQKHLDGMRHNAFEKLSRTRHYALQIVERHQRAIDKLPSLLAKRSQAHLAGSTLQIERHAHSVEKNLTSQLSRASSELEAHVANIRRGAPRALQSARLQADSSHQLLLSTAKGKVAAVALKLENARSLACDRAAAVTHDFGLRLSGLGGTLHAHGNRLLSHGSTKLDALCAALPSTTSGLISRVSKSIQTHLQTVINLGPEQTLRRGYTIVNKGTGIAKSADDLLRAETIEIRFKDGKRKAEVTE